MSENVPENIDKKTISITEGNPSGALNQNCPIRFVFVENRLEEIIFRKNQKAEIALQKVFGTSDPELFSDIISRGTTAIRGSQEMRQNILVQVLADYEPKNTIEAKLCAQAHNLFSQGMRMIEDANQYDMISQQEHCLKNAFKCLRLHNETVLVLDKLRRGGEQKVIVQHVNVEGGQAAIMTGNFQAGVGVKEKNGE